MAVIGKIREKSWLLVIVVGGAMIAFILTMNPNPGGMQGDEYGIGTVNGEKVDENQYNNFLNNARNNIFQQKIDQNPNVQPEFTRDDQQTAERQAWETAVVVGLIQKEYDKLGLVVDDYELENVLYAENDFSPSSLATQFRDSITGEFAPNMLRNALDQLRNSDRIEDVQQYEEVMNYVRRERIEQKYMALLSAGLHATTLEGKREFENNKTVKNITYVYQPFTKVPEEEIGEPTENEIKEYYDKHKHETRYQQKASRNVTFFEVPIRPNEEDTLKAMDFLVNLKSKFEKSKDDSAFVIRYSDIKYFTSDSTAFAQPEGTSMYSAGYPVTLQPVIQKSKVGDVVGPYQTKDGVKMSKILDFKQEETATVRHILLSANSNDEFVTAQRKADSIVNVIKVQNNFEAMVEQFSEDPGSIENGGRYENFPQGMMVAEFNDFSFYKPIGTLGTVKTNYGIHIVEVLDRQLSKYPKFATLTKYVEPTKTTADQVNSIASNYIYDLDDKLAGKSVKEKIEIFEEYAKSEGYHTSTTLVFDDSPALNGFTESAEGRFLRFLYDKDVKIGDITSSPIHDQSRFVIAILTDLLKEGEPRLDIMEPRIIAELKTDKKAQYLTDRMAGKNDLHSIQVELNAQLENEGVTFSTNNPAVGNEPQLIGTAFSGLLDGEISVPVKGNNGVFVVQINQTTEGGEMNDFSEEISEVKREYQDLFFQQFQRAMKDAAKVVDNRKLRSFGIR